MARSRLLFVEQNRDGTVGGSHQCLLNLVKSLDRETFECRVVFYEENRMLPDFARFCQVDVFSGSWRLEKLHGWPLVRKSSNAALMVMDVFRIALYLIRLRPALIHMNNSICVGYDTWAIAGKILRIPVVTHERNHFSEEIMKRLAKYNVVFERVFCVSEAIRNHCLAFGVSPAKLFTTYEGIDIQEFRSRVKRSRSEVRKEFGLSPEQPVVGIVGNIRHWKGQHVVARAIARVRKEIPDIHCLLIGVAGHGDASDQAYIQELEDYVKKNDLTSHVTLTGFRVDIPDLLNAMDVQIHASITMEPFGIVLLEGMSLGLPVVASNVGGPTEIIKDGVTGLLCTPGNDEEMAECLVRLLSDKDMRDRLGKAALEGVERFDLRNYVAEIANHYRSLTEKSPTGCFKGL